MKKVKNNNLPPQYFRDKSPYISFILLLGLLLFLNACQESTSGCLDVKATNFDVTKDKACTDGCCVYPNLKLQLNYAWGTEKLSFNKKYLFDSDSIEILNAQMYLSDFQLITSDNKKATTIDSIFLYRDKDTIKALNNFTLVGKNIGFDFSMGKFDQPTQYSKLSFQVGLSNILTTASPSKMPSSSPLSTKTDSMYLTTTKTYVFNKLVIARKKTQDTLRLFITTPKTVEIVKKLSFTEGYDATIPLTINYLQLLNGVKMSDAQNTMKDKIVSNTASSIQ